MKRQRKRGGLKTLISLGLVLALLAAALPASLLSASAVGGDLQIGLFSDPHYYPATLTGDYCEAFQRDHGANTKQFKQSEALLDSALAALEAHAKANGMKYVLVPGDLTKDGELEAHQAFAKAMEAFEKRTGIQVAVIPGNHDINNTNAQDYSSGKRMPGKTTSPEQYLEIYKNLGFDLPGFTAFTPPAGKKGGMLSYAADLDSTHRLIALDTCKYSADQTKAGADEHETGGMLSPELLAWALKEARAAKAAGKTVIGMGHHSLVPHAGPQDLIFLDFMLDDWLRVREAFAEAGMHFYYSGHIHVGEIGDATADNGAGIYDVATTSLVDFPNTFREIRFTGAGEKVAADVKTYAVDCVKPVTFRGKAYPVPYAQTTSYGITYGQEGMRKFLLDMLDAKLLGDLFGQINGAGGLSAYLASTSLDLEGLLDGALNGGVKLGGVNVITTENVMGLINEILGQVDENYIQNPKRLMAVLEPVVTRALQLQVSTKPSTRFYEEYGVGDPNQPGTLEDMAEEVIIYLYGRVPGAEDNAFLQDTIARFDSGENAEKVFNLLVEGILNDLLQGELLPALQLKVAPAFPQPVLRFTVGALLDGVLRLVLLGDASFQSVVDFVFRLGVLPYEDLNDTVESLKEDYWTDSQNESLGAQIASFIRRFAEDDEDYSDNNVTLHYTGKREVTPSQAEYRLPTMLNQTLGADAGTRTITWFTKDTVRGTDIQLTDARTGKSALGDVTVKKYAEDVAHTYPGGDLGIVGLFSIPVYLRRHTVEITGLRARAEYTFKVGDAAKGWWSPKGSIRTADGSKTTTFLSFTDEQAQLERQYARTWGKLTQAALKRYPDAAFIVSVGDQTDKGTNVHHWQWFLDSAQSALRGLPLMPTTGNHEDGGASLSQIFQLPGNGKETESGAYYSYDYNNLHFMHLNTNDLEDDAISAEQLAWLKADAQASGADWKIVVLHKALYSNGSHYGDKDVIGMREQLGKLLPELGIDLVLQGHDHVYLRTAPMKENQVLATESKPVEYGGKVYDAWQNPQGPVYSIAGASGVKLYNIKDPSVTDALFPRAEALADLTGPVFAAYTADNGTLYYDAYMMNEDGSLRNIDSFAIQKSGVVPFERPEGWDDLPAQPESDIFPDTGDVSALVFVMPFSLLLAAGYVLFQLRRRQACAL